MNKFKKLQLQSLDKQFYGFNPILLPQKGWIYTIRSSLSITLDRLAKKLNVSTPAVMQFERNEVDENISLKTLKKVAQALDCQLYYSFIPKDRSLSRILEKQAYKKAAMIVKNVHDSMSLEQQEVKNQKQSVDVLAKELLENYNSKIWNDD